MKRRFVKNKWKKGQVETLDSLFAFLTFIIFLTLVFMLLKLFKFDTEARYVPKELVDEFFNKSTTKVLIQPYFINTSSELDYGLLTINLDYPSYFINEEYIAINNTLYIIKKIKHEPIFITYVFSNPGIAENVYPLTFTCNYERCLLPPFAILYHFNKGILDTVSYKNKVAINDIVYMQDGTFLRIDNFSYSHKKIFFEHYAGNFLINITSRIINHNSRLFMFFKKIQPNVVYTNVKMIFHLDTFNKFISHGYNNVKIDYELSKLLNRTLCYNDTTKFIGLVKDYQLVISSDNSFSTSLCFFNESLNLSISFDLYNTTQFKIFFTNLSYNPSMEMLDYELIKGMPITKKVISEKNVYDIFVKRSKVLYNLDSKSGIIISDKNGKVLYELMQSQHGTNTVKTYLYDMIMDMGNYSLNPVYVSFIYWNS